MLGDENQSKAKYPYQMSGKGYEPTEEDDMDRSSDDGVAELPPRTRGYINSPNGRRPRTILDDDSDDCGENDGESDIESDDGNESDAGSNSDSDKYADFQQFYDETKRCADDEEGEEMSLDECRKHFRRTIRDVTVTYFGLKKDPTFKKIIETVRDLKSGTGGYDMTEALDRGFEQRRHLLDRVYDYLDEQAEGSEDDDNASDDEEENVGYGVTKEFPSVYS